MQDLDSEQAKRVMRQLREKRHPRHVPVRELTEQSFFRPLLELFRRASGQGKEPACSYQQLVAVVEKMGLTAALIVSDSEISEQQWNTPSPEQSDGRKTGTTTPGRFSCT